MFEPLQAILNKHGDTIAGNLAGINRGVESVANNTQAQLVRNTRIRQSVPVKSKKVGQLRNNSAYGWIICWAATDVVEMYYYIAVESAEGFMLRLKETGEKVDWYLPPNGVIFVENTSAVDDGFANFEIELLTTDAGEAYTGPNDEHIERSRREPVPSGTPLDTHVADDPPPSASR